MIVVDGNRNLILDFEIKLSLTTTTCRNGNLFVKLKENSCEYNFLIREKKRPELVLISVFYPILFFNFT